MSQYTSSLDSTNNIGRKEKHFIWKTFLEAHQALEMFGLWLSREKTFCIWGALHKSWKYIKKIHKEMDMFVKLSAFEEHCTNCINLGNLHFLSVLFEWLTQHRWFPRITNRFSCRSNSFLFLMSLVCWFFAETRIAFEIESNGHHWCCIDHIFFLLHFCIIFHFLSSSWAAKSLDLFCALLFVCDN